MLVTIGWRLVFLLNKRWSRSYLTMFSTCVKTLAKTSPTHVSLCWEFDLQPKATCASGWQQRWQQRGFGRLKACGSQCPSKVILGYCRKWWNHVSECVVGSLRKMLSCGQLMQILIYVPEMWNTCLRQRFFNMSPSTCEHIPTTRFDNVRQYSEYHLVWGIWPTTQGHLVTAAATAARLRLTPGL